MKLEYDETNPTAICSTDQCDRLLDGYWVGCASLRNEHESA